eukprot:COSAG01_NODE_12128_length_1797_cov_1.280919_2_plen_135_part_00
MKAQGTHGCAEFLQACMGGCPERIAVAAEAGCDTVARNRRGMTGLMLAAGWGSTAAAQAVLDLDGTELEAKDEVGYTAFLWACVNGNIDCIRALAEAGCDTFVKVILADRPTGAHGVVLALYIGRHADNEPNFC